MIFRRSLVSELANTAGAVFTVIFSIVLTIGLVRILGMAAGGRIDSGTVMEMVVYEALVAPQTIAQGTAFITVTLNGTTYSYVPDAAIELGAGSRKQTKVIMLTIPLPT